jgi:hypothetical protein
MVLVELALPVGFLPTNHERVRGDSVRIESYFGGFQRYGPVLCRRGSRNLVFRHGLYRDVVSSTRYQTLEGGLSRPRRFAFFLHVEDAVVGIRRIYRDLVVCVDGGGVGGLPQHQQCGLVAEPHDELPGRIWFGGKIPGRVRCALFIFENCERLDLVRGPRGELFEEVVGGVHIVDGEGLGLRLRYVIE